MSVCTILLHGPSYSLYLIFIMFNQPYSSTLHLLLVECLFSIIGDYFNDHRCISQACVILVKCSLTVTYSTVAVRSDIVTLEGSIWGKGRQKITLEAVVQNDVGLLDITKHDALDTELNGENRSCSQPQLIGLKAHFGLVWFGLQIQLNSSSNSFIQKDHKCLSI